MKVLKKRVLSVLLCGMVFLSGIVVFPEKTYAYNKDVSSGVVPVVFYVNDGAYVVVDSQKKKVVDTLKNYSGEWGGGTGFFIGKEGENPQYIVTNFHVVDDYVGYGEGSSFFTFIDYYEPDTYGERYEIYLAFFDYELRVYYSENDYEAAYVDSHGEVDKVDLALLRLKDPTDKRHPLPIMVPDDDMVGETIYTVGFPGNADNEYTSASKYGVEDVTVHKGSISKFVANTGVGVERIAVDAVIQHGNSGGPLVTEEGYVIGVNTNVISNSPYENQIEADYYALNASELVRFLDKSSVDYQLVSADTEDVSEKAGDDASGEKDESESDADKESTDTPDLSEEKSGGNSSLFAGIGAAVVAVAVIAVLLSKKKKKPEAEIRTTVAAPQAPAPAVQKRAMLRSMSNQHNGMTVAVHAGSHVMIGRDPANCKVVFSEGTEGVSGRHCSVTFDEASNEFILTDLRSTYGTFLLNGQKLNPNVPYRLKAGDGFYLGVKDNSFRVELG